MSNQPAIQVIRTTPLTDAEIALEIMKLQVSDRTYPLTDVFIWPVFEEYVNRIKELNQTSPESTPDLVQ
jgi:hypothetical protein